MNITINRKAIILGAAALALIITAAILIPHFPGAGQAQAASDPAQADVDFTRAFYTVDYRNRELWLAALKPMATESGYILIETTLMPDLWPQLAQAQTVTIADQVRVTDNGLKAEGESALAGGKWQIRSVEVSIAPDALWPTMTDATFTASILLIQQDNTWKFGMFLSDQDIALFQKGGQP